MHVRPIRGIFAGAYTGSGHHPRHRHSCWEIIYQRTGQVATRQGSTVFHMHPGMVLVHPPFVMHEDDATEEYSLYYVQVDAPLDIEWPRVFSDDTHQTIGRLCEALVQEWLCRFGARERMIALMTEQLDLLLRRALAAAHRSPEEVLVASAQRILEERFNQPMTTTELARELGVSRSALYAQFATVTGQTPKEYVLRLRLDRALGMLHHTESTLEAIAAATGFYSSSHLTRHIKAAMHLSPGSIRRAAQKEVAGLPSDWKARVPSNGKAHVA